MAKKEIFMPRPLCAICHSKKAKPVEIRNKWYILCKKCAKMVEDQDTMI